MLVNLNGGECYFMDLERLARRTISTMLGAEFARAHTYELAMVVPVPVPVPVPDSRETPRPEDTSRESLGH